jgi:hypothetical protein
MNPILLDKHVPHLYLSTKSDISMYNFLLLSFLSKNLEATDHFTHGPSLFGSLTCNSHMR